MDIREQYLFATLSKKSKIVAKNGTRLLSYFYDLVLYPGVTTIVIKKVQGRQKLRFKIAIQNKKPNKKHYPVDSSDVFMSTVEDVRGQSINSLIILMDVFKMSIFKLETHKISNDFTKDFLVIVRNLRIDIDDLKVRTENDGNQNEMYNWVMQNCRNVKTLKNFCSTSPDFEWNSEQPFTLKGCYIGRAPFLTLGHLTRLFWNCRLFQTADNSHKMTNQDLKQLIRLWMDGSSKLEYLEISVNGSINFQEAVIDIEKAPVESAYLKFYHRTFNPGDAYKIQRIDGKEAVVCLSRYFGFVKFVITTHFNDDDCDLWPSYVSWNFADEEME